MRARVSASLALAALGACDVGRLRADAETLDARASPDAVTIDSADAERDVGGPEASPDSLDVDVRDAMTLDMGVHDAIVFDAGVRDAMTIDVEVRDAIADLDVIDERDAGPTPDALGSDAMRPDVVVPDSGGVDIRTLGVVCDGSDQRSQVQSAMDGLAPGAVLVVPCVIAIGAPGLRLSTKSRVTLRGASGGGFRALSAEGQGIDNGMGPFILVADRCDECVVESLTFDSNLHDIGGFGVRASNGLVFRNNSVRATGALVGGAVSATSNTGNFYLDNLIENVDAASSLPNGTRGFWIGNSGFDEIRPVIAGNTIRETAGTGIATHLEGGVISGNIVEDAGNGGAACIKRVPMPGTTTPSIIELNRLLRCGGQGLQLDGESANVTVRGNHVRLSTASGLYVQQAFTDSRIEWNTFEDNRTDVAGGWQGGILVFRSTDAVIEHNSFLDTRAGAARTQDHGLLLYPGPITNLLVRRNTFMNHLEAAIGNGTTSGPMTNLQVVANSARGNRYGLELDPEGTGHAFSACTAANDFAGNVTAETRIHASVSTSTCAGPTTPPAITTTTLPDATVAIPYAATLRAAGGIGPYRWDAGWGTLPAGLVLDSSGRIGGTPRASGAFPVVIFVYDSAAPSESAMTELMIAVSDP